MKVFPKFITTAFISFLISIFLFFAVSLYLFLPDTSKERSVQKTDFSVAYSPPLRLKDFFILICVDECPVVFSVKVSPKNKNISVNCIPEKSVNTDGEEAKNIKNKTSASLFTGEEYSKIITFTLSGFENTVNNLGGIEIETPYGMPAPAKNSTVITRDERVNVYGASLGCIITEEKQPSAERLAYYCYVTGELCLKFLKNCNTESYRFLNQNAKTDISYTEFYDNYEEIKNSITNAVCDSPKGKWKDGWFYME